MSILRLFPILLLAGIFAIDPRTVVDAQSVAPKIRKVFVPADHPESWPKGNWIPLSSDRLRFDSPDKLQQSGTPRLTWIRKAHFNASFRDGLLLDGELDLELTSFPSRERERDTFVPWSDVNLAISRLSWQNTQAELGTSLAGDSWLIVPPEATRLTGNWSFRGRPLSRGHHFRLVLPESAVSQFQLQIPRQMEFQLLHGGTFERSSLADSETDQCTIALSSNAALEFVVSPQIPPNLKRTPSLYYHGESSLTFSRDEVRFRRELLLEVLDQPLETLIIPLPPNVAIRELNWGGVPLSTWSLTTGTPSLLRIDLPDPVFGLSRPLRIAGTIPFVLDQEYAPPAMVPQNAISLSEQISLYLAPPLELNRLNQTGYRQSAASTNQDGSSLLVFQQLFPNPTLELIVGLPAHRMQAQISTRIEVQSVGMQAICDVLGKVSSGASYEFPLLISEGWEPLSVTYTIGSSTFSAAETDWLIAPVENSPERKMVLELARAVTREQPINIEVTLQANRTSQAEPTLPVLWTLPDIPAEHRLMISNQLLQQPEERILPAWISQTADQWPSEFRQTRNGKVLELKPNDYRLFSSTSPERTPFPKAKINSLANHQVTDELVWTQESLQERVEITIASSGQPTDRIQLSVPRLNEPLSWSLEHASATIISSTILERNSGSNLSDLEVLEFVFSEPLTSSTVLIAQRTLPDRNKWSALLPVLLEQKSFSGRVLFFADDEVQPVIRAQIRSSHIKLKELEPFSSEAPFLEATYHSNEARLTGVGATSNSGNSAVAPFSAVLNSLYYPAEPGTVLSRFDASYIPSGQQIQFRLPVGQEDIWVELAGEQIIPRKLSAADTYAVFIPPGTNSAIRLKISYRTRHALDRDRFDLQIPVPQIEGMNEIPFEWTMRMPSDLFANRFSPGLNLHSSLTQINWRRRLFGPVGQSAREDFFFPTDVHKWEELFSSNPQPTTSASESSAHAVPSDWNQFQLSGSSIPESVSSAGWSESAQMPYAWLLLLCSLLIGTLCRIARLPGRRTLGIIWFLLIIPGTIIVSPQFALYTGALLSGSLFAILIPRPILLGQQRWAKDETEIRVRASPESLTTLARVVLIATFSASSLVAQNTLDTSANDQAQANSAIDVLIPLGSGEDRTKLPAVVYIREQDRSGPLLQSPLQKEPLLITSAEYRCRLAVKGPVPLQVKYQIYLPPGEPIEKITLPLAGANLARDVACQVDGVATPIQIDAEGFLEIRLTPPEASRLDAPLIAPRPGNRIVSRRKEIVLNLYPPVAAVDSGRQFQLEIPRIPQSFVTCELNQIPISQVKISDLGGELRPITPDIVRGELGETGKLAVRWGGVPPEAQLSTEAPCQIEASPLLLIEAHPTFSLYRYRVGHRAIEGETDFLRWTLPSAFELRKIRTDALLRRTETIDAGQRTIFFDLLEPLTPNSEPVMIEAEFLVESREIQEDEISIPIPALFPSHENSTSAVSYLSLATQLGIHSPPELPLTVVELPGDRLRSITGDSFLALWPEDASLQVPEFSFEATAPSAMKFLFTQIRPSKRAWVSELGMFEDQFLEWTWNAEIQTERASAFEHEFRIDPRLEVVSVSVQEDQAERVHRWFKTENRLTVRLARKTESSQQITILARMKLSEAVDFRLPEIRLLGAERMESLLELRRSAFWKIAFDPPIEGVAVGSENQEKSATLFEFVASFDRSSMRSPPSISLSRITPPIEVTRQTRIRLRADGDFDLQTQLTISASRESQPQLAFVIPSSWIPRLNLAAHKPAIEWIREPLPDGRLKLTTPANSPLPGSFGFQTTVPAPSSDEWTLHLPEMQLDAIYRDDYFLKPADGWIVQENCREATGADTTPVKFDEEGFEQITAACSPLVLLRAEGERARLQPVIPLALSRIDVDPGSSLAGKWFLFYEGRGKSALVLEIPQTLSSWEIEIDGEKTNAIYDPDSSRLTCPLPNDRSACWIEIDWVSANASVGDSLMEVPVLVPVVEDIPILRQEVILSTASQFELGMHNGYERHSALATNGTLLAQLVDLKRNSELWGETFPAELESLGQTVFLSLSRNLDTLPDNDPERARLQKILVESLFNRESLDTGNSSSAPANLLFEELLLDGGLPNRRVVYGTMTTDSPETVAKTWFVSEALIRVCGAVLLFLMLIPVLRLLLRPTLAEWLAERRAITYLILGLFWWTCLDFSFIGLVIASLSLIALLFGPRRSRNRVAQSSR